MRKTIVFIRTALVRLPSMDDNIKWEQTHTQANNTLWRERKKTRQAKTFPVFCLRQYWIDDLNARFFSTIALDWLGFLFANYGLRLTIKVGIIEYLLVEQQSKIKEEKFNSIYKIDCDLIKVKTFFSRFFLHSTVVFFWGRFKLLKSLRKAHCL